MENPAVLSPPTVRLRDQLIWAVGWTVLVDCIGGLAFGMLTFANWHSQTRWPTVIIAVALLVGWLLAGMIVTRDETDRLGPSFGAFALVAILLLNITAVLMLAWLGVIVFTP